MTCCEQDNNLINVNVLFAPESYAPVPGNHDSGASLYTWELIFWGYVFMVHAVLMVVLTSPVDIFDTTISVLFTILCLMFLCRPRGNHHDGGGGGGGSNSGSGAQSMVLVTLVTCTWLTFSSIPHVYEPDRLWLLGILIVLDMLLLLVHMYDGMPTMHTIVMGRLTFISLTNLSLAYAFMTLHDRLETYVHDIPLQQYIMTTPPPT